MCGNDLLPELHRARLLIVRYIRFDHDLNGPIQWESPIVDPRGITLAPDASEAKLATLNAERNSSVWLTSCPSVSVVSARANISSTGRRQVREMFAEEQCRHTKIEGRRRRCWVRCRIVRQRNVLAFLKQLFGTKLDDSQQLFFVELGP